jgi:ribosome-associated protein
VAADGDTSPAGPGDDALRVTASVVIPAHELSWSFGPSGGPGGQHANRAHTRAEVRFDVRTSSALTDAQRARLRSRLGDVVTVSADDERSQLRNRRLALDRLRRRLAEALRVDPPRRPTRPTKGAVERRLEAKRHQAARKRERRRPHDD